MALFLLLLLLLLRLRLLLLLFTLVRVAPAALSKDDEVVVVGRVVPPLEPVDVVRRVDGCDNPKQP
jgi:hypothetical protein